MSDRRAFRLADHYEVEVGDVLLSGIQALVRLPLDQRRADSRRGLRTGTFISGYQGSPLGGYDLALQRESALLAAHDVHLVPGVNEELAATAVWGSQQPALGDLAGRDGVVGIWYGKAPGVDRCGDVFKHANLMGVARHGGVLVLAGDDPTSKSSTIPSASEVALCDARIPVLAPGTIQELLDLGLHGVALSRFSGLWVGMKVVTNVADGFGTASVSPARVNPIEAPVEVDGRPWRYRQGGLALPPANLVDERDLVDGRLEAARAYARANGLNEVTRSGGDGARVGIVAAGKVYREVVQALEQLGIGAERADVAGVRLLRLGMIWPLEPDAVRGFAQGLDDVIVVEEKRSFVEQQVRDVLYDLAIRPRVVGKRDEQGRRLVPEDGELSPDRLAALLAPRLPNPVAIRARAQLAPMGAVIASTAEPVPIARTPYFCSGCPHNRSTLVPDGSVAGGGIGCHTMAAMMGRSTVAVTQMGGEGTEWIGRAAFTDRRHLFQNIGDGTFFHSGSLAVRACVAAGVNITFKILYNGAVAMTGGQDAAGGLAVPELTRLLEAEGVRRTIVCAEDPRQYGRNARFAANVDVWPRARLDEAQRLLRDANGVTTIIYDQGCAAEKRRARKRGRLPDPAMRVVINEAVCEGCGDCGVKSNCLSVQPVETEFGRKTRIHQSSCNRDYTCLDGDCPSFVTVTSTRRTRRRADVRRMTRGEVISAPAVPEPADRNPVGGVCSLYLTGVGGSGVVTVSQVLATAALLDGLHVTGLDQTGLSQKGGPVVSHLKVSATPVDESNAVGTGSADLYLAFDLLVAADPRNLERIRPGSVAVLSTSQLPTGSMVADPTLEFPAVDQLVGAVSERTGGARDLHVDAVTLAEGLFGDHMLANMLLLGAAYQLGVLPVSGAAIEQALDLNGVAVAANREAFRWGRRYVIDPLGVWAATGVPDPGQGPPPAPTVSRRVAARAAPLLAATDFNGELRRIVDVRVPELIAYQGVQLARRYLDDIARVRDAERVASPGATRLTEAYGRYLFKLLAYKDEYEVARLSLRPELAAALAAQAGGRVRYRLHPPVLRALGVHRKISLGPWFRVVFRGLYALRRLRGTPFDPFGRTDVRRTERGLPGEYRALVEEALGRGSADEYERAVRAAELPDLIRGYEMIKLANVAQFRDEDERLLRPG